jgi:tetratricopeptide (TPR) repeat protein
MRRNPAPPPIRARSARLLGLLLAGLVSRPIGAAPAEASPEPDTHQLIHEGAVALSQSNFPQAAQFFAEAAAIDPDFTRAHFGLALAALGRGDRKEFEKSLRRTDALTHGAPEVRYVLAVQRWRTGDLRVAEEELRGAARLDPSFLEARYALGAVQAARGDLVDAAPTLRDALGIDPACAPARLQLGFVLAASGDLDGARQELREALSIDPDLEVARPEEPIPYADRRVLLGSAHGGGFGLPLPVPRPTFLSPMRRGPLDSGSATRPVPEWFLDYQMALFLEDAGRWSRATTLLERALSQNDREEIRAAIANRLVDYLPHRHLARASFEAGDLREARLHLEAARNQGAAPTDDLPALETLIRIASARTSIVLQPLPDHTPDDSVAIRGILLAREGTSFIDVGGQKAPLRAASPEEVGAILKGRVVPPTDAELKPLYFEIPAYRLATAGPNLIRIRPGTAGTAGVELEILVVRDQPSPAGVTPPAAAGGTR